MKEKEIWLSTENKDLEKDATFMGAGIVRENRVIRKEKEDLFIVNDEEKITDISVFEIQINNKKDEERAIEVGEKTSHLIIKCSDWRVIPLENLIASLEGMAKIIAHVKSAKEGKLALEILELGVSGVLLETNDVEEFNKLLEILKKKSNEKIKFCEAEIITIKNLGLGARACLDTSELMEKGEGALVGCSSQGMFLIQGEVEENEFVSPRPFRVNAGAVSLYTLTPENKTRYLEEISSGDEILVLDREGNARSAIVCRSKIEVRPLIFIEAKFENKIAKIVLQNAETVRFVTKMNSIAVTDIKRGDKILTHFESGGRHFGTKVESEIIIEK